MLESVGLDRRHAPEDPPTLGRHEAARRTGRRDGRKPRPARARRAGQRARPGPATAAAFAAHPELDRAHVDAQHLRGGCPVPERLRHVLRPGPLRRHPGRAGRTGRRTGLGGRDPGPLRDSQLGHRRPAPSATWASRPPAPRSWTPRSTTATSSSPAGNTGDTHCTGLAVPHRQSGAVATARRGGRVHARRGRPRHGPRRLAGGRPRRRSGRHCRGGRRRAAGPGGRPAERRADDRGTTSGCGACCCSCPPGSGCGSAYLTAGNLVSPDLGWPLGPAVALVATGCAVAAWMPDRLAVEAGVAAPLLWTAARPGRQRPRRLGPRGAQRLPGPPLDRDRRGPRRAADRKEPMTTTTMARPRLATTATPTVRRPGPHRGRPDAAAPGAVARHPPVGRRVLRRARQHAGLVQRAVPEPAGLGGVPRSRRIGRCRVCRRPGPGRPGRGRPPAGGGPRCGTDRRRHEPGGPRGAGHGRRRGVAAVVRRSPPRQRARPHSARALLVARAAPAGGPERLRRGRGSGGSAPAASSTRGVDRALRPVVRRRARLLDAQRPRAAVVRPAHGAALQRRGRAGEHRPADPAVHVAARGSRPLPALLGATRRRAGARRVARPLPRRPHPARRRRGAARAVPPAAAPRGPGARGRHGRSSRRGSAP